MPVNLNLAVYHQTVEDPQRTVYLQITSQTGNVGEAEVKGLEVDITLQPTDWLQIGGAYAYTDAEFTDPQGDVIGYTFDFGPYADAPKNTYSVFFRAEQDIAGIGLLSFRGDFYHSDKTYFSNLNDTIGPGTELDSYELLNFHLALDEIAGSQFSVTAYLRNATDEEYERGGLPLAGVTATNATIIGEPRTYGLELTYRF
jgi:iron complex outermembrane receptor protein